MTLAKIFWRSSTPSIYLTKFIPSSPKKLIKLTKKYLRYQNKNFEKAYLNSVLDDNRIKKNVF